MKKSSALVILILGWLAASAQSDSSYYTVRLSSFDASVTNNITQLRWKTVCFLPYANFQIQKSANGTDYNTISSFTANRLRCQQPFDFMHSSSANRGRYLFQDGSMNKWQIDYSIIKPA